MGRLVDERSDIAPGAVNGVPPLLVVSKRPPPLKGGTPHEARKKTLPPVPYSPP